MSIIEENSTRVITRYRETREINCLNKKRSSLNSCGTSDKTSDQKKSPSLSDSGSGLGESGCEELLGEKLMRDFKYSYNYICNDCDTWSEQRLIQLDREEGVAATLLGFGIRKNKTK
ncbi:hypothetical protein ABEB36_005528 [Hypothenemus hampei]|uniref:Uncharacterized protein n=1 Tax=Hypothenemus hampei TaxID=57062 RepID=A0ABD1EYH9_HYPHA